MTRVAYYSKDQDSSKKKPIIIYLKDLFRRSRLFVYVCLRWPSTILEIACFWATCLPLTLLGPLPVAYYSKDQDSSKKKPIIIYLKDLFRRSRLFVYVCLRWPSTILEIACFWATYLPLTLLGPLHVSIYVQILVCRLLYVNSLFSDEDVTKPWGGGGYVSHAV